MTDTEKNLIIRNALALEVSGHVDDAAQHFAAVGDLKEASRVLVGAQKFKEAGDLLLNSLGVTPNTVHTLVPELRKYAFNAAICYGRAQLTDLAVQIFLELKELVRAAELLERSGDRIGSARILAALADSKDNKGARRTSAGAFVLTVETAKRFEQQGKLEMAIEIYVQLTHFGEAARLCEVVGRAAQAAQFYTDASMPMAAGRVFAEIGEPAKAVAQWKRVPTNHPDYRAAAQEVIRFSRATETFELQVDMFLSAFVKSGPMNANEIESFFLLSKIYEQHDLIESAKESLQHVVRVSPGYRDAARRLRELEAETSKANRNFERALKEEQAFEQSPFVDLPPLPSLPPLKAEAPQQDGVDSDAETGDITLENIGGPPQSKPTPAPGAVPLEGETLGNRYRIIRQIGKGGMARVFEVHDIELNERVALKLFSSSEDEAGLVRFRHELKLSRQLQHSNIVRMYDLGTDRGHRYITMELLNGRDLSAFMKRPMSFSTGINYLMQACAGLHYAHEQGIVHRDIKPENLFLTERGTLKVMDFGIAKGLVKTGVTIDGVTSGTPRYLSPEQIITFAEVTRATDIYALGIVAYAMFTGRFPFDSKVLLEVFKKHLNEKPVPPRELNGAIPPALEAIILKCLQKAPGDRFASAYELAMALDPLRREFEAAAAKR